MEGWIKIAWALLALIHVMPAAVLFAPSLVERLYAVSPTGDLGVLLVHRGALFLAVVVASLFAMFDADVRRSTSVIVAISVIGFLVVYARAGFPSGALWTIALMDGVALVPLAFVSFMAWRP